MPGIGGNERYMETQWQKWVAEHMRLRYANAVYGDMMFREKQKDRVRAATAERAGGLTWDDLRETPPTPEHLVPPVVKRVVYLPAERICWVLQMSAARFIALLHASGGN